MRKTILAVLLTTIPLSLAYSFDPGGNTQAREGAGGHGGDPYEIYAVAFPDPAKLKAGIEKVKMKVETSPVPEIFKSKILTELSLLESTGKFMFLDQIILMGLVEGVRAPMDAHRFVGLGAMTGGNRGDAVYFSRRSLQYSPDAFASLLLHEVIHHLVMESLSTDETFVTDLTAAIMNGNSNPRLNVAITNGIYFRPRYVSTSQLVDALFPNSAFVRCRHSAMDCQTTRAELRHYLISAYGENLIHQPLSSVMNTLGLTIHRALGEASGRHWYDSELWARHRFSGLLNDAGIGSLYPTGNEESYCKLDISVFNRRRKCPANQRVLFSDIMKF